MKCPNCQNEVQSDWRICGYCGHSLTLQPSPQLNSYPPPPANYPPPPANYPHPPANYPPVYPYQKKHSDGKRFLPFIIGGIVILSAIAIAAILIINNFQNNPQANPLFPTTSGLSDAENGEDVFDFPTNTSQPVFAIVTNTPFPTFNLTSTPPASCPGAKEQRLTVNKNAFVCTKLDRLIVRVNPSLNATEIIRIYTGTQVKVIGGAKCSDNSSWWKVEVPAGTNAFFINQNQNNILPQPVQGWVREGSDDKDPYFLCPMN